MEVKAISKYQRVQPRKVRIIADEVRGKTAIQAAALLRYHPSKGARALRKVLISAVANAANNNGLAPETLKIAAITVDEGPRLKRIRARAMGRGNRILKKTAHITVVVEDVEEKREAPKQHGTKAKPRPTFANVGRKKASPAPKAEAVVANDAPVVEPEAGIEAGPTADTEETN